VILTIIHCHQQLQCATTNITKGYNRIFKFDIVGRADNVNGLDALEAAHQVCGGELGMVYAMNVQVVQGSH
jgi:hypothetical protein